MFIIHQEWQHCGSSLERQKRCFCHVIYSWNTSQLIERRGEPKEIVKSEIIVEYNKYMNGVDKCDQYLNYSSVARKSIKWWKKVFFRMLELAIVNAMVLHSLSNPEFGKKHSAHKQFCIALVHELVQPLLHSRADPGNKIASPPGRKPTMDERRLKGNHFPESRHPKRGCCSVCAYQKYKDIKTSNYCPKCDKFICKKCFETFHTQSFS